MSVTTSSQGPEFDDLAARAGDALRHAGFLDATDGPLVAVLQRGHRVARLDFAPELLEALELAELVEMRDDTVRGLVRVAAWESLLVAHDPDQPHEIGPETVLGVNNTTRALAALTPRLPVDRALDVATGPGGLALLMAKHCRTVIATDLSPHSLRFARINAAMNGAELDLRVGDLFAPVDGDEPFDLITANLPFVVSPDTSYTFRDGGRDRDGVSREALVGAAAHLADGGTAVLLCNWTVPTKSDPTATPASWLEALGLPGIIVYHSTDEPEQYAARWNQFLRTSDAAAYDAAIHRWMTAYADWGIEGVASGAVIVRRDRSVPAFVTRQTMSRVPNGDGGSQLLRILANGAWLSQHSTDDALLAARLDIVGPNRLEQTMRYDGAWTADSGSMVLDNTAGIVGRVELLASHTVFRLDGDETLQDVIDSAGNDTGLDASEIRVATLTTIRHLLSAGCLAIGA